MDAGKEVVELVLQVRTWPEGPKTTAGGKNRSSNSDYFKKVQQAKLYAANGKSVTENVLAYVAYFALVVKKH